MSRRPDAMILSHPILKKHMISSYHLQTSDGTVASEEAEK